MAHVHYLKLITYRLLSILEDIGASAGKYQVIDVERHKNYVLAISLEVDAVVVIILL